MKSGLLLLFVLFIFLIIIQLKVKYVRTVQGCSIFYQSDFKSKKALCDAEHVKLTQIPLDFPESLVELRIIHQSIKYLDQHGLDHLVRLETMEIESSQLKQIGTSTFRYLSDLKHLNLRNNSLRIHPLSLPMDVFRDLPNLRSLNLAQNPIDLIPDWFFDFLAHLKLEYLWLHSLQVHRLQIQPNAISSLDYLVLLDLSFAQLETLHPNVEQALVGMPQLHKLYLGGNPWYCDCALRWLPKWFVTNANHMELEYRQNRSTLGHHDVVEKWKQVEPTCAGPEKFKDRPLFSPNNYLNDLISSNSMNCAPMTTNRSQNVTFDLDKPIKLLCEFYYTDNLHNPFEWLRDQIAMGNHTNDRTRIYDQSDGLNKPKYYRASMLTLSRAAVQDSGLWTCVLGPNQIEFKVNILDENGDLMIYSKPVLHTSHSLFSSLFDSQNWIYTGLGLGIAIIVLFFVAICFVHRYGVQHDANNALLFGKCHCFGYLGKKSKTECSSQAEHQSLIHCDKQNHSTTNYHNYQTDGVYFKTDNKLTNRSATITENVGTTIASKGTNSLGTYFTNTMFNKYGEGDQPMGLLCCSANYPNEKINNLGNTSNQNVFPTGIQKLIMSNCIDQYPNSSTLVEKSTASSTTPKKSLLSEHVIGGQKHLLVSCDSPEPKLMIATQLGAVATPFKIAYKTGFKQAWSSTSVGFSTTTTTTYSNISSSSNNNNETGVDVKSHHFKPCPVHGHMKLNQVGSTDQETSNMTISSVKTHDIAVSNKKRSDTLTDTSIKAKHSVLWTPSNDLIEVCCPLHGESSKLKSNLKLSKHIRKKSSDNLDNDDDDDDDDDDSGGRKSQLDISRKRHLDQTYVSYNVYASTDTESKAESANLNDSQSTNSSLELSRRHSLAKSTKMDKMNSFGSSLSNYLNFQAQHSLQHSSNSSGSFSSANRTDLRRPCYVDAQRLCINAKSHPSGLRVTTLPTRISHNKSDRRSSTKRFSSQHIFVPYSTTCHLARHQWNTYSTRSLTNVLEKQQQCLTKPGSKHKLDTETDSSSERS